MLYNGGTRRKLGRVKVIVIGGGTSGLMASVSAACMALGIVLARKINTWKKLLHGWNAVMSATVILSVKHIPGNGNFLYSAFSQFCCNHKDINSVLRESRRWIKEEDHGRMFPVGGLG